MSIFGSPTYEDGFSRCDSCGRFYNVYDNRERSTSRCQCARFGEGIDDSSRRRIRQEYTERTGYPTGDFDPRDLARRVFNLLLEDLSPRILTERFVIRFQGLRESFQALTLQPENRSDLVTEIHRFIEHIWEIIYHSGAPPKSLVEERATRVMRELFGSVPSPEYKAWEAFQRHGLRHILDEITRHEQNRYLQIHVELTIQKRVEPLNYYTRIELAKFYIKEFEHVPGSDGMRPELLVVSLRNSKWHEVLLSHAQLILRW